jgi:APA family basic amino acid/polyamine antiporter
MIGTGIFTSLGFQVMDLNTGFTLLVLWLIGGITALTGAMCYAELGSMMPRSGGEYHFLTRIYHPSLGFVSGWISFIVGFAAPTAAAAMALSAYCTAALDIEYSLFFLDIKTIIAIVVILALTVLHARSKKAGAGFQNIMTSLKILVLLIFIIIGWRSTAQSSIEFAPNADSLNELLSPHFAIALFFVSFAYSGWNAAAYISSEISNPSKNIPLSLIFGTLLVTLMYLGITWVFLKLIPIEMMYGKIEIGFLYGQRIFGADAGSLMGLLFAFLLFSTVSSLIITGPRVTQVMGTDYPRLRWFSHTSRNDTPARAIYIQAIIAIIYLLSSTFEQMITYIGFSLNLMTMLTVLGMMIQRRRNRDVVVSSYRVKPYPLLPILFLLVSIWIMIYGLIYRPVESIGGLLTALMGYLVWTILRGDSVRHSEES